MWGERKTGMSDELRQSSTSEIIFKLPIPPKKNNTPSKQNQNPWPKNQTWPNYKEIKYFKLHVGSLYKNDGIKNTVFQVLIIKNHFLWFRLCNVVFRNRLSITSTNASACDQRGPKEFQPQQKWPRALVWVEGPWTPLFYYHKRVGHHQPFDN